MSRMETDPDKDREALVGGISVLHHVFGQLPKGWEKDETGDKYTYKGPATILTYPRAADPIAEAEAFQRVLNLVAIVEGNQVRVYGALPEEVDTAALEALGVTIQTIQNETATAAAEKIEKYS